MSCFINQLQWASGYVGHIVGVVNINAEKGELSDRVPLDWPLHGSIRSRNRKSLHPSIEITKIFVCPAFIWLL